MFYLFVAANSVAPTCRFTGDSHVELPCNEVSGTEHTRIAGVLNRKAKSWWRSVIAEPHSFTKLVYRLGYKGQAASNVETAGAVQVTRGNVFIKGSAVNFTTAGDKVCCQVQVGGSLTKD
jgi:hypothetical protein